MTQEGVHSLIPAFDPDTGCLPAEPQFHNATVEDVRSAFVEAFSGSVRRPLIIGAYVEHCGAWRPLVGQEPREQWMDGSFTTAKAEPGDVDFVMFVPAATLNELSDSDKQAMLGLFESALRARGHLCHAYMVPVGEPGTAEGQATAAQREYWQHLFGHQRPSDGGRPKGIVRLEVGGAR
jgi:hypothetical protein